MTPDVWREVSACLDRLMDLDAASAESFLRQLRAERPELAEEVESLWLQGPTLTRLETPPPSVHTAPTVSAAERATGEPAPTETAGGYELLGEIARGGMGAVYEARDPTFDRTLAVKVLLPELRDHPEARYRFLREARITGQLQHPGIPPIHELGQLADGSPFFAMKLIRGRTLAASLKDRKPDAAEAVATFEHICRTLAYAHSQGTIHRDLKPGNVMVGAFGEVQVMDWGLAREMASRERERPEPPVAHAPGSLEQVTESGSVRGTPSYMAPEQARGDTADLDERCDVFGLGGILVAMLTRQPTYTGPSADMFRQARVGEVGPAIQRVQAEQVDADLQDIVRRCLAPRKEDRFRHAGEVADAVTAYRESARRQLEQAIVERRMSEVKVAEERRRRRVVIGFGVALLLAVSVGLGAVSWFWWVADDRRQKAEDAERRVTDEHARTEETARQARKAIKESFILATEDPEFQKHGMQEARRLLLDRALVFYREFTAMRADDLALREEVADAHGRIGQILTDRGENANALAAYAEAIAFFRRLKEEQPGERRFPERLADLYLKKAFAEQAIGQRPAAAESLRTARGELAPLLQGEPDNPEWVYLDARILGELGRWYYGQGKLDDAAAADQEALDKLTRLIEVMNFKKVKVSDTAMVVLVGMGHVRKDQRRPADALALYHRAVPHMEQQHKANPSPHATAELARLYGSIALVQDNLGQHDQAGESAGRAIALREQLAKANPLVPEYRLDLALSYFNLAGSFDLTDPKAKENYEKAVPIMTALVKDCPDHVLYRHHAAYTSFALARVVRQDPKQVAKAEGLLAEARTHLDELDRRKAMTPLYRKTLAEWETEAGQVERIKERYAEAVTHFERAEGIYRELIGEKFQVENCRLAVARQQMSFAYAASKTGDFEKALRVQYAGVAELIELLKSRPDDRSFQHSLANARANMVELGKEALNRDVPTPTEDTLEVWVRYNESRLARWRAWMKQYPAVDGFRQQAVGQAVWIAAQYAGTIDPARKVSEEERKKYLGKTVEALALAREIGLRDAKTLENHPGLVHFRKLPEYQQFLQTLK